MRGYRQLVALSFALTLPTACVTPTYVDKSKGDSHFSTGFNEVVFQVHEDYTAAPPACVAIMPLDGPEEKASDKAADKISTNTDAAVAEEGSGDKHAADRSSVGKDPTGKHTAAKADRDAIGPTQLDALRRALYAHLAPQGRRVEKPVRVDFILDQLDPADRGNLALIGQKLGCDALIMGHVTEWSSHFYGIYSRVAVGADLKMVRASDGAILWEGKHTATMLGGTIPLTPIGVAMGVADAAINVEEEQTFRAVDDLARRLVGTIPDDQITALDDPAAPATPILAAPISAVVPPQPAPAELAGYQTFLSSLADLPPDQRHAMLATAVDEHTFGAEAQPALLDALVSTTPPRAEDEVRYATYLIDHGDYSGALTRTEVAVAIDEHNAPAQFARGRMLIKLGRVDDAEAPILRAVALDGSNADYLNALGYVNGLKNKPDRSIAAYQMAFAADHADGYALYNIGVLLYNKGDDAGAADAFYGAGLAYLKAKNYGQAGKALANLRELSGNAPVPGPQIRTLESALDALGKKGEPS